MPLDSAHDVHARIIYNPTAGRGRRGDQLRAAAGVLAERGWTVSWRATEEPGGATGLARAAAEEGVDVAVVAGGDGTINEALNGLVGTEVALGVLPAGTGNVLAAQLGLIGVPTPLHRPDLPAAAEQLCAGRVRRVDLGYARPRRGEGRYFLMWAGVGLDAAVTHELEGEARDLKRALGPAAFGAIGLKRLAGTGGVPALVRCNGQRVREQLLMAVVCNIRLYGGAITIAPEARIDDGQLDAELFLGRDVRSTLQHLGHLLTGSAEQSEGYHSAQARRVRIIAADPLPVHLDAEPFGTTPVTIEVRPRALPLLVPPSAPAALFTAGAATDGLHNGRESG